MISTPATWPFISQLTPVFIGSSHDQLMEEERFRVLHNMQVPSQSGELQPYSPFLGESKGKSFQVGRTLNSVPGCSLSLDGKMSRCPVYTN